MGVVKGVYDLHKEAHRDAQRHKEKLKDAFKKSLHDIISEENIISTDGNKKIKVPIKSLDNYKFIFDNKKQKQTGQGDGNIQEGDIVGREPKKGQGTGDKAGDQEGEEVYEAEVDLDDLVELMIEDLKLPKLDPKKKAQITAPETVWNDVSRRGPMSNMDKRRTILENMKRNARQTGQAFVGGINKDDLRFRSWNEKEKPVTSAVIIAMMDVSGSMYTEKKYIARAFFFWMMQFLKRKYEDVEIVFIAHTTTAKIVSEQDFFHRMESGGTICSSAYELALQTIEAKYDPNQWNIFSFHFSDGETWGDDADKCVELVKKLLVPCNMVGYGEIDISGYGSGSWGSLLGKYEDSDLASEEKFVKAYITDKTQIYQVLQKFFSED